VKLSIVVPAYNEEARLGPMVQTYLEFFSERYGEDLEFIIVVNGSVDRTPEIAREFASKWSQVKVIIEDKSVGKGAAIMLGFAAATGDLIGFVDADGSTGPEAYLDLVENIGDAGLIMASRWLPGAVVEPKQPLDRRIASRIFNWLVRWFFSVKITDTQCGAKVLTRDALDAVLPHLGLTRWAFDVDLLFQARREGFKLTERATVWRDVAGSRLNVPRASMEMFAAICRLRLLYSPFSFIVSVYNAFIVKLRHRTRPQ
jgi:glycosyltransferase involved in cell wall biosynthesis